MVEAAAAWSARNLPATTPVVAAPDGASTLRAAGLRRVTGPDSGCGPGKYVLITPALRARATTDRAAARCLRDSLPVAQFVRGVQASELRRVAADPAQARHDRRQAEADRRRGGTALAGNPAITCSAAVRAALRAGALDVRAETVLANLSQRGQFRLRAVVADPAESRAGLPARTVEITRSGSTAVKFLLVGLSGHYRPQHVSRLTGGGRRLTWAFRPDPVPLVN